MKVGGKKEKPKNEKRMIKGGWRGEGKRPEIKEKETRKNSSRGEVEGGGWIDACFIHSALTLL